MSKDKFVHKILFLSMTAIVLSACTSPGTYPRIPAPTVESTPSIEHGKDKPPTRDQDSTTTSAELQTSNPAIQTLFKQSRQARETNNLPQAISYIERALRIEPRRADLWLELAGLHLEALNFQNAEQVARKSLSFTQESVAQARSAWYIIATALEATGDAAQAAKIRRYVKTL